MSVFRFEGWEADIAPRGGSAYAVHIDGREVEVRLLSWEEGLVSFEVDGRPVHAVVETLADRVEVTLAGRRAVVSGHEIHLVPTSSARSWYPGDSGEVYVYDASRDAWRKEVAAGLGLLAEEGYVSVPVGDALYLLGGRRIR